MRSKALSRLREMIESVLGADVYENAFAGSVLPPCRITVVPNTVEACPHLVST